MSVPYRILVLLLFSTVVAFGLSPWLAVNSINQATRHNDQEVWSSLVNEANLKSISGTLLSAMLDLKMYAEIEQNPREAMTDNLKAKEQVPLLANKLSSPKGFSHLLCGDLNGDLDKKIHIGSDCWAMQGNLRWESPNLRWESPTLVRVTFKNPETEWQSSLVLERQGLFKWRGVAVDLPVEAILNQFSETVGLEKSGKMT